MARLEDQEGIKNLAAIIKEADGIIVVTEADVRGKTIDTIQLEPVD